jgi:hypothetical protein
MIEKKVTTLFGNLISVQGKYIEQAIKKNMDLKIKYKDDIMIVACSQLLKPIKTTKVPDLFSKKMNTLYYYQWKPKDQSQGELI